MVLRAGHNLSNVTEQAANSALAHTSLNGGLVPGGLLNSFPGSAGVVHKSMAGNYLVLGELQDQVDPRITDISPAPGTTIYPQTVISFKVTDNNGIYLVELQVDQGQREVIHDGIAFLYPYLHSTIAEIVGGYQFQVRRTGGWRKPPTFYLRALDPSFNNPVQ